MHKKYPMFAAGISLLAMIAVACVPIQVKDGPDPEPLISINTTILGDGDIILHATSDSDSQLISALTGSEWSHSGIIVKDGADFGVIDNYPGRTGGSIKKISINQFCAHSTTCGVWRYVPNRTVPAAAVAWAKAQIGAGYSFELLDPMTNGDKVQYCAEFVWRAYLAGGDNIVPAPLNLKGANTATTRQRLIDYVKNQANVFQKPFVAGKVDDMLNKHDGLFIAPGQLDGGNPKLTRIQ